MDDLDLQAGIRQAPPQLGQPLLARDPRQHPAVEPRLGNRRNHVHLGRLAHARAQAAAKPE